MPRFLKRAALACILFSLPTGLFCTLWLRSPVGIALGLAAGYMFGLLLSAYFEWQSYWLIKNPPNFDGEEIRHEGPANRLSQGEIVSGRLFLTDRRLLFQSHQNIAKIRELSIPLATVLSAQCCPTAYVVPNGLRVQTIHGAERFVVRDRHIWIQEIALARENPRLELMKG